MATANSLRARRRAALGIVPAVLMLGGAGLWWAQGDYVAGMAEAGTAYGARTACSCRHLAGRTLASCERDFLPGMEAVFLSENREERSVTARVPLIASNTATFRDGFGCVLQPWERQGLDP